MGSKNANLRCRVTSKDKVFYSFMSDREATDDEIRKETDKTEEECLLK